MELINLEGITDVGFRIESIKKTKLWLKRKQHKAILKIFRSI